MLKHQCKDTNSKRISKLQIQILGMYSMAWYILFQRSHIENINNLAFSRQLELKNVYTGTRVCRTILIHRPRVTRARASINVNTNSYQRTPE